MYIHINTCPGQTQPVAREGLQPAQVCATPRFTLRTVLGQTMTVKVHNDHKDCLSVTVKAVFSSHRSRRRAGSELPQAERSDFK